MLDEAAGDLARIEALLGGDAVLGTPVPDLMHAHAALEHGLPGAALAHLLGTLTRLHPEALEKALGMSLRTVQRRRGVPGRRLSREQSGRMWKLAEIIAIATDVFGGQAAAEAWLEEPAMALDWRRPLDLLATPVGMRLVEDTLGRLRYGVYL